MTFSDSTAVNNVLSTKGPHILDEKTVSGGMRDQHGREGV